MLWSKLGEINPADLVSARVELHWAAQIPSAAGSTLLPLRADASHTSFAWIESMGAIAGEPIAGKRGGVRFCDLALIVIDSSNTVVAELPLAGKTFDEGMAWLAKELGAERIVRPKHDMPKHPVATGAPFGS